MKKYIKKSRINFVLILIIISTIILPIKALAINVDKDFYDKNDILFYDPCEGFTGTDEGDGDGTLTGKDNREKVWCFLRTTMGLSKNGAIGVMGNLQRESHFTPNLWQIGGICDDKSTLDCGYGLAQWTAARYKSGDKSLWKYAGQTYPDDTGKVASLITQLEFLKISISRDAYPIEPFRSGEKTLIDYLKDPNISIEEAAYQYIRLYGYWDKDLPRSHTSNISGTNYAIEISKDNGLMNLPCGNPTTPEPQASGTKPKILIGPGHTGNMEETIEYNGNPKIMDRIYANKPELQDVWDVAQIVKPALEEKGYEVLMTKNNVNDKPYSWDRAKKANDNKVDLAFEIHTSSPSGAFGSFGQTWAQFKGGYREDINGNKFNLVASDDVIKKSKEYATKFTAARIAAGEPNVVTKSENTNPPYYSASRPEGNITLVQLWSEVPWIYLEAGANPDKNGDPSGGLTDAQKDIYAKGIIDGVVASIPPGTSGASNDECESSSTTGSGDAAAIVEYALKYAWDTDGHFGEREHAKQAYLEPHDKYATGKSYNDCGAFVMTVMKASGADKNFRQLPTYYLDYIKAHPEKYEIIENKGNTSNLRAGDIIVNEQHIFLFVGEDDKFGNARSASLGTKVPQLSHYYYGTGSGSTLEPFTIARLK